MGLVLSDGQILRGEVETHEKKCSVYLGCGKDTELTQEGSIWVEYWEIIY